MTRRSPPRAPQAACWWLRGLPAKGALSPAELDEGEGCFIRVPAQRRRSLRLRPASLVRYLALCRHNRWWLRPAFGGVADGFPSPCSLLLWERDTGDYGLLLPLMSGDPLGSPAGARPSLGGGGGVVEVHTDKAGGEPGEHDGVLLLSALGADPHALVRSAFTAAARVQGSFRGLDAKAVPPAADLLGWCTWDAFYRQVDAERVAAGLISFAGLGLVPPRLGLDDGWLQLQGERLSSFSADEERFPDGLRGLTQLARRHGVEHIDAWIALTGYWAGVDPAGPLGKRFRLLHSRCPRVLPWRMEEEREVSLIHPDDAHRFFDEWLEALRRQGVDGVKVDNQASLWHLLPAESDRAATCRRFLRGLQAACGLTMDNHHVCSMGQSLEVASQAFAPQIIRNSEDYFPGGDAQRHVLHNAYNTLWTSAFGLPDWDMFQSHDEAAGFHAAARAISGGPITLSDRPGEQDLPLLESLCTSDGRILRLDRGARPTKDRLLSDCSREPLLLKLENRAGCRGVLGLFHCRGAACDDDEALEAAKEPIEDRFRVADVPDLAEGRFAVYLQQRQELRVLDRRHVWRLELPWRGFEVATLAPLEGEVAALGLLDKLAGAAALRSAGWLSPQRYHLELRDGGRLGLYWGLPAPARVTLNGIPLDGPAPTPRKDGLLVLEIPRGETADLEIYL